MKRVVSFEARRSKLWLRLFAALVFLLVTILAVFLIIAIRKIGERQTFDLLTLFQEDREIIAEFWQDTLLTFWEELPQRLLLMIGLAVGIIASLFWVTRRKRRVIGRKLTELAKYQRKQ